MSLLETASTRATINRDFQFRNRRPHGGDSGPNLADPVGFSQTFRGLLPEWDGGGWKWLSFGLRPADWITEVGAYSGGPVLGNPRSTRSNGDPDRSPSLPGSPTISRFFVAVIRRSAEPGLKTARSGRSDRAVVFCNLRPRGDLGARVVGRRWSADLRGVVRLPGCAAVPCDLSGPEGRPSPGKRWSHGCQPVARWLRSSVSR